MDFEKYIQPELLVLIPVLYLTGEAVKKLVNSKYIPVILGVIGIILSCLYVGEFSAVSIFTATTQGILVAGCSVYCNQIWKQGKK